MKKLTNEEILQKAQSHSDDPRYQNSYITGYNHGMSQAVKQRDEEIKEWIDKNAINPSGFEHSILINIDSFNRFLNQNS